MMPIPMPYPVPYPVEGGCDSVPMTLGEILIMCLILIFLINTAVWSLNWITEWRHTWLKWSMLILCILFLGFTIAIIIYLLP